ncbi:MAG: type II toxin-antitoxin system HipA family toxin [Muribaculaceae bacterium]|nr:type II toxin-antitoxin system HipA family toxin [Muribaculaceae bacterium]
MNQLKVMLWGEEIGRLVWETKSHTSHFTFNPELRERPDIAPLTAPVGTFREGLPIYSDDRRIYQKLPPFIADSLPDSWGNKLFEQWAKENRIQKKDITPLYKLMFIGKRGMGAFEFKPADEKLNYKGNVNVKDLYDLSLKILEDRTEILIPNTDNITMEALIAVGTSAGGRQMKAVIAINKDTGQIISGQIDVPEGFQHYIIKFEDKFLPTTEIEMAYYDMAVNAGIEMEECFSLNVEGISHFMTRRFDRKGNEKILMQTLAAINPEADSYEDLIVTARRLNLSEKEIIEIFRRIVFNVITNNTDDHNKNFSFLLEKDGKWKLSPAYDMTFIFNTSVNSGEAVRCMSLYGKIEEIKKEDLIEFARENNIRNPEGIINNVVEAVENFPEYSKKHRIPERFSNVILTTINKNLRDLGFKDVQPVNIEFISDRGMYVQFLKIKQNSKGLYELHAMVDGKKQRRFINPKDKNFREIQELDGGLLNENRTRALLSEIFERK